MSQAEPAARSRARPIITGGIGDEVEAEYGSDDWDARRLGVAVRRGRERAHFGVIHQRWLREPIKRWARFRLSTGYAFTTVDTSAQALARFSLFLEQRHPEVDGIAGISRDLLVEHLSWMASSHWATTTRSNTLTFLKMFLEWGRRHGTLEGLPADAVIYEEEVSRPGDALPKFIPEFVMAQLESEASLARLRNPTVRHLVIVLMETGVRGGDACELAFSPMVDDSVGWPCLRFANSKVSIEQLIPLSAKAAETIRAQQAHVLTLHPEGSPWLFPGILDNADGAKPYAHSTLSGQLGRWQKVIGVHDEAGQPVRVHAHQFRHTVGTRLINAGVPQHVIQKLLGHASPRMTARYAQIHDHTVRDAFERYCRQRVNTDGEAVPYDPGALTADAEWVKHNLSRVRDSLPNGYCGRPPQQDCSHPNACLTCPDFQTTPEFLDVHRQQATANRKLIARADANGQFRLAENLRQVQASLDHIIPSLEALEGTGPTP
ncbi:MAG: tyrosine-type recombinase/integrase [Acidimicrobiales bacterium]|nr:tyrosine-type recombinase/integrase [Acidimicrobiales bacterium]